MLNGVKYNQQIKFPKKINMSLKLIFRKVIFNSLISNDKIKLFRIGNWFFSSLSFSALNSTTFLLKFNKLKLK